MSDRELCREIVRQLWPYLDGALNEEWRERVTAHLEQCADCASHYDYERAFLEALHGTPDEEAEFAPLRGRVLAALVAEGMKADE